MRRPAMAMVYRDREMGVEQIAENKLLVRLFFFNAKLEDFSEIRS